MLFCRNCLSAKQSFNGLLAAKESEVTYYYAEFLIVPTFFISIQCMHAFYVVFADVLYFICMLYWNQSSLLATTDQ